jgi:hypothetical protein
VQVFTWFKDLFHKHDKETFVENIRTDSDIIITIGFKQCKKCGYSKLIFIYGNK